MMDLISSWFLPVDFRGVLVALVCGGLVGLERQLRGRPAGIRTCMLICLGSQTFVQLGITVAGPAVDASRVLGQIITGIGFLGAGVILARGGLIYGVTSASTIWMLAAIGGTIGLGYHLAAVMLSVLTVLVLVVVDGIEAAVVHLRGGVQAKPHRRPASE